MCILYTRCLYADSQKGNRTIRGQNHLAGSQRRGQDNSRSANIENDRSQSYCLNPVFHLIFCVYFRDITSWRIYWRQIGWLTVTVSSADMFSWACSFTSDHCSSVSSISTTTLFISQKPDTRNGMYLPKLVLYKKKTQIIHILNANRGVCVT